ncbi:MAG: entericidin A/B family lipoprotein [Sphingopyxis sp.]
MMKRRILALMALALVAGCNTIEGAGRDIQSAGQVVEDAAD